MSLRPPPPLAVPLLRQREHDGSVSLLSGDDVIATAVPAAVQAQAPPAPTVEQADIATRRYVGFAHHRFPTCFVCGTARNDGLRIYAGQVGDSPLIASPWTPESDDPLLAWAVLDCPGAYAIESVDHRAPRSLSSPRSPSSSVSGRAPGSGTSSARGRSAATAASTTPLLRSTTPRDASSPSPTPSGSSCETPPLSADEPSESRIPRTAHSYTPVSHLQNSCGVKTPRVAALASLLPGAPSAAPLQSRRSLRCALSRVMPSAGRQWAGTVLACVPVPLLPEGRLQGPAVVDVTGPLGTRIVEA